MSKEVNLLNKKENMILTNNEASNTLWYNSVDDN